MKTILNRQFDLQGNEILRLLKLSLFNKILPIGRLRGGPGARCLIILSVLHYCGGLLYGVQARHGNKLDRVRRALNRLKAK